MYLCQKKTCVLIIQTFASRNMEIEADSHVTQGGRTDVFALGDDIFTHHLVRFARCIVHFFTEKARCIVHFCIFADK